VDLIEESVGMAGLLHVFITLVCIAVSWWCIQAIRWDVFFHQPKSARAILLQILLSVVLGYEAAAFLINYSRWSAMIKWLF
jgi:uncharacterized integral membrane protein (TIGR02327 family)